MRGLFTLLILAGGGFAFYDYSQMQKAKKGHYAKRKGLFKYYPSRPPATRAQLMRTTPRATAQVVQLMPN